MRARKQQHPSPRLERCEEYLSNKVEIKENTLLRLEIGCGKGKFITEVATKPENKDIVFYAVEKVPDVMVMAAEKAAAAKIENLRFILGDAKTLAEICPPHRTEIIYLNFSDPWHKKGYFKRRLTYRKYLALYFSLLREGGELCFKTDNVPLFDFSLEELASVDLSVEVLMRDLHASPYAEGNVMTEYEANFSSQGFPICSAKVIFRKEVQND